MMESNTAALDQPATIAAGDFDPLTYVPPGSIIHAPQTAIAIPPAPQPGRTMLEFRKGIMEMSIPMMLTYLREYTDWRTAFRRWLLSIMVEGIHYGWAVGFAPKWCDAKGNDCPEETATHSKTWNKKLNNGSGGWNTVAITEFLPKRNLLLAGADLVCDALWVADKYEADMETWQQLGSNPKNIIKRCKLYSKITGEYIGEGSGGRENGEKFMGLNSSIKMAENSAKRCAVLNAYGLRDLFTQDMEEPQQPKQPSSPVDPNAPTAQSRDDRVTKEAVDALGRAWQKTAHPDDRRSLLSWSSFVMGATNRDWGLDKDGKSNVGRWLSWTPKDMELVTVAIAERGDWQE